MRLLYHRRFATLISTEGDAVLYWKQSFPAIRLAIPARSQTGPNQMDAIESRRHEEGMDLDTKAVAKDSGR
jgi:hypothetical protein